MKISNLLKNTLNKGARLTGIGSILSLVLFGHTGSINAQSTWLDAINANPNSWANPGNWSGGIPSTLPGSPGHVIFKNHLDENDVPIPPNINALTLDGVYFLNKFVVQQGDYGTTQKTFAAPGTAGSMLVFKALNGESPSMLFEMENATAGNQTRNMAITADLHMEDDLTITRNGGGSATQLRRLLLTGTISGDANLTLSAGLNNSHGTRIELNGHNTFTGDVILLQGYLFQQHADSLGTFGKTLIFRGGNSFTWDITSATATQINGVQTDLNYNLLLDFTGTAAKSVLIHANDVQRQAVLSGNITGGTANTTLHMIALTNQQLIFTGQVMDFKGKGRIRYGSEVVLANANANGVAWENVSEIMFNDVAASGTHSTAFLLRGDYTFNGNLNYADTTTAAASEKISIGQINHNGQAFHAVFNGSITHAEKDVGIFNLVSENGGSATFTNSIVITAQRGLTINDVINTATSGGTIKYYEAAPNGDVVIAETARVAGTVNGTESIGTTTIYNGVLAVNTPEFYSDVTIRNGATLSGNGLITGNVNALAGGSIDAGYDVNANTSIGYLAITGDVTLNGTAGMKFQVEGATFNLGTTAIGDLATLDPLLLSQIGNHDFVEIGSTFNISDTNTFTLEFLNGYTPVAGDVFHLMDFDQLTYTSTKPFGELWSLPSLSIYNLHWNYDYFETHGILAVIASSIWKGAASNNDNLWTTPNNWTNGVPSTVDGSPSHVTFSTYDLNADALDLNGETFYLNTLTIEKAYYNTQLKELGKNGTLVFQAGNGSNPVIHFTGTDADTSATAANPDYRNMQISANIVLQDDTTIIREHNGSNTNSTRRLIFSGVVSGNGDLYLQPNSNSSSGMISFTNHNTFTGDIYWASGYITQTYADSLGTFDKTFYLGTGTQFTWDISNVNAHYLTGNIATDLSYNINFGSSTKTFLIQAGNALRKMELSGDITGGTTSTLLHIIAQNNEQLIFSGETMTLRGYARLRYGSEVVVASANSGGIAWQNISRVEFSEAPTNAAHNGGFLLRGDFTYNGALNIINTAEPTSVTTFSNYWSIGQINHEGNSYDATFNGNVSVAEDAYRSLNLVSESNGSATFNGTVTVANYQGMDINKVINPATSGGTYKHYEEKPTGTVIFSSSSYVASAANGTDSIGLVDVNHGKLRVDTQNFYANVDVHENATLSGSGKITGKVYVYEQGILSPTGANGSETGSLQIVGTLELGGPATLVFDVKGATFKLNNIAPENVLEYYASEMDSVSSDHDHISVVGIINAWQEGSLKVNFLQDYLPDYGDVFNFVDALYFPNLDDVTLWDLPDLSVYSDSLYWNYDYLSSHGVLMIVPEPSRMLLIAGAAFCLVMRRHRKRIDA